MTRSGIDRLQAGVTSPVRQLLDAYVRPRAAYFGINGVTSILTQALWLYPPIVIGVAFDAVLIGNQPYELPLLPAAWIPETATGQFWFSVGVLVACYVGASVLYVAGTLIRDLATYRLQHELRTDTYAAMQSMDTGFFERNQTGELMSVVNNDVNLLERFFTGTVDRATDATFIFLIATGYMFLLNWQLAVVAFLFPVTNAAFNYWYSNRIEPRHQERRQQVGDINSRIENNIAGMHLIKVYGREADETDRVRNTSADYMAVSWIISRTRTIVSRITGFLPNAGYVLLFLLGGVWVLNGPPLFFTEPLAAGTVLAFLVYNNRLGWPLKQVTGIVDEYQEMKAAAKRVVGLLNETPTVDDRPGASAVTELAGRVTYENVTFGYDDTPTVKDVSFEADSGEMIGLVGSTGAGKSTLVKLLMRFYDVDEGSVRVDGHDVRDLTLDSLRSEISYVGQEPFLFDATVRENVAYSVPDASDAAIENAARQAGAHGFVQELADGYDTTVGERGTKLSGGQRQRIAIARAIISDPAILVLDEATSHVDNETEAMIQANLRDITADRTTFVIAHRLSTVRDADRIVVLDDGEIVERGDHDSLLDAEGTYAYLWDVQAGRVESPPNGDTTRPIPDGGSN